MINTPVCCRATPRTSLYGRAQPCVEDMQQKKVMQEVKYLVNGSDKYDRVAQQVYIVVVWLFNEARIHVVSWDG